MQCLLDAFKSGTISRVTICLLGFCIFGVNAKEQLPKSTESNTFWISQDQLLAEQVKMATNDFVRYQNSSVYSHKYQSHNPQYNSQSIAIPLGEFGVEMSQIQLHSELSLRSFSITREYRLFTDDRYSISESMIFRLTLKGYNLFKSEKGEASFFSLDRVKERQLRKPEILLSFTQHF